MGSLGSLYRDLDHPVLVSVAKLRLDSILPIIVYDSSQYSSLIKYLPGIRRHLIKLLSKDL